MRKVYSNGPSKDFVKNVYLELLSDSGKIFVAAPYVTVTDDLVKAVKEGKTVDLLVGLNAATSPQALKEAHGRPNLAIRYLTRRFHAKIFLFDDAAMVGSSNLTDGGLLANREAMIWLKQQDDTQAIDDLRALFAELWESAQVLTTEKLNKFADAHAQAQRLSPDQDALIESAVGRAEPININVGSTVKSRERIFLEDLRRQVYEQYRPAFSEVTRILQDNSYRRIELQDVGIENETNRFLNWVRLTRSQGDESWQSAPLRSLDNRLNEITRLGEEWSTTTQTRIPHDYIDWLHLVRTTFGSPEAISTVSKDGLSLGLLSLHAFVEQLRFVKGGVVNLPSAFWNANNNDVSKVKATLTHLLYGSGDFIQRLHDTLYDPRMKIGYFGKFCALELFGTIKPSECPPMNGRMAKALRFLGFEVRGA